MKKFTINPNFCPVCGKQIILGGKPTPDHSQRYVQLTEGHTTHVAVCKACKPTLTLQDWANLVRSNLDFLARNATGRAKEAFKRIKFKNFKEDRVKE